MCDAKWGRESVSIEGILLRKEGQGRSRISRPGGNRKGKEVQLYVMRGHELRKKNIVIVALEREKRGNLQDIVKKKKKGELEEVEEGKLFTEDNLENSGNRMISTLKMAEKKLGCLPLSAPWEGKAKDPDAV